MSARGVSGPVSPRGWTCVRSHRCAVLCAGAKIQVLDLPGIIEGAKDGKGRGRQVIGTARTCNLICIVLDATR